MGAVVGLTAYIQAKNELSPELQQVIKASKNAQKEMYQLDEATQAMVKEMRQIRRVAEQNGLGFKREFDKMQREIQETRRQLGILDSSHARPEIHVDDQARREIEAIRQEIKALDGAKAKVQIEAAQAGGGGDFLAGGVLGGVAAYGGAGFIDQLTLETQANARRSLLGATPVELAQYQQQAEDLRMINPNVDRIQIKDLLTQATRYDQIDGNEYIRQALQLSAIRPDLGGTEDFFKTQMTMKNAMPGADINQIGDALGYISRTALDIRNDTLDSLQEYSVQMTGFIDTPEKMAMLVEAMNGIWNTDVGFDTLKEVGLKLNNVGDLENVLKTAYEAQGMDEKKVEELSKKEAETIGKLLSSGSIQDRQYASGVLLQTFASIQDEFVRQNLLNELASGPGENAGRKELINLLKKAGEIAVTDPLIYREKMKGQLDRDHKTFQENDPLRGFIEAKTLLSNELIGLGVVLAQDLEPAIRWSAEGIKKAKEMIDGAPVWVTLTGLGLALGGAAFMLWKFKVALEAATLAAVQKKQEHRKKLGGDPPDFDIPGGPDNQRKPKGKGKGKGGWFNPFNWGSKGNKTSPSKFKEAKDFGFKNPLDEATKPSSWRDKFKNWGGMLPKGDAVLDSLKGAWDVTKTTGTNLFRKVPETFKTIGGMLPSGDSMLKGLKIGWEGVKASSGSFARKIPIAGIGIGLGQILTADDPLKMAGQIGSEILGSAAGAAAGASVGSAIPGVGTTVGGIVGSIAGAFGGAAMYDKVLEWWNAAPATPPDFTSALSVIPKQATAPVPVGPPIPVVPAVGNAANKPKVVSVTIPQVTVPLQAEGVLQDIPTMLKMLSDPSVGQKIKDIIEKSLMDALETMGGVAGDPITR
ncbi:hypothetical protein [Brevibacillus formosus]|uniref:hypothetical protein n=1 Tax=Brevibacillus formosus TaxID=54913 RepID=UPI003F1AB5D6